MHEGAEATDKDCTLTLEQLLMNELRCTITAFFIFIFSIPWYWDGFENFDFYGSCKTEYCTDRQGDIDGVLDWAWRVLMHSFIGIAFMMVAFYQWESPYRWLP